MTELTCIICPRGCLLKMDEAGVVTGNACPRGAAYAKKELTNPTRTLTTTVQLKGAAFARLPVKTRGELPKSELLRAVRTLDGVVAHAPIEVGDVVARDLLGLGVDVVATRRVAAASR